MLHVHFLESVHRGKKNALPIIMSILTIIVVQIMRFIWHFRSVHTLPFIVCLPYSSISPLVLLLLFGLHSFLFACLDCDYIYLVLVSFWLFCPLAYSSYRIKLIYNLLRMYFKWAIWFRIFFFVLAFLSRQVFTFEQKQEKKTQIP